MKQFHFEYRNQKALKTELLRIKRYCGRFEGNKAVFQIYTKILDENQVREVTNIIEQEMPEAFYYGCLSCGNLLDGRLSKADTIIACAIFEYDTTRYEVAQISCSDPDYEDKMDRLISFCNENSWIKAVEILTTSKMFQSDFLVRWNLGLRDNLYCTGGCSSNPENEQSEDTYVFSKGAGLSDDSTIFFMLGGEDMHAYGTYVLGYEPLGGVFTPTRISEDGSVIHELNGRPAFEVYKRYLKIEHNEHFFSNALGFPMIMTIDGIDYLRVPVQVLEDDSLVMSAKIAHGSTIRLSYGNPSIILRNIDKIGSKLADIGPESIRIYSCFTRKLYWGDDEVSRETENFANLAPATGFFTRGEILSLNKKVSLLNATLVVVGLREGETVPVEYPSIFDGNEHDGIISYEDRLINFIGEATKELEEVNQELARASIMDGLTQIYNRAEIQRRIKTAMHRADMVSLIMLDIDNFKHINDTYGHKVGDEVIQGVSSILRELNEKNSSYSAGRWGGEEFMLLLEGGSEAQAMELAERIRKDFNAMDFPKAERQSVSVGITSMKDDDTEDTICVRVDKALYQAKSNGKNRVERI